MFNVGDLIRARYQVLEIFQGGMGVVYKVSDQVSGETLAIKEVDPQVTATATKQTVAAVEARFTKEVEALKNLSHPRIPEFREDFKAGSCLYLIMDFVEGTTLGGLILDAIAKKKVFTETAAKQMAVEILEIFTYLHSRPNPVIFRDLKPDNIMMTTKGAVLIDFGIIKQWAATMTSLLQAQNPGTAAIGTAGHAAPEVYAGKPVTQSDFYALGTTLYQMLTLKEPPALNQPPGVRADRPDITAEFEAIILRATQEKVADRYQKAQEMREAIENIGRPPAPPPAPKMAPTTMISDLVPTPPRPGAAGWIDKLKQVVGMARSQPSTRLDQVDNLIAFGDQILDPTRYNWKDQNRRQRAEQWVQGMKDAKDSNVIGLAVQYYDEVRSVLFEDIVIGTGAQVERLDLKAEEADGRLNQPANLVDLGQVSANDMPPTMLRMVRLVTEHPMLRPKKVGIVKVVAGNTTIVNLYAAVGRWWYRIRQ